MIKFNDPNDWLEKRIEGVKKAYIIPNKIKKDIAVDVGANIGAFSIVNTNKFKKIISFEPSDYSYDECKKNIKELENCDVYKYAVSNKSNQQLKLKAYKSSNYSGNASTIESNLWDNNNFEIVNTISLDDIFEKFNINRINYLKIDCEGGEYDFLMNKDLKNIDSIGIEIHLQLKEKATELYKYLLNDFNIISELNDGITMHKELTLINKNL